MSAEKIIRAQARRKLKDGGWSKAVIGFSMLVVLFMIVDCVAMFCATVVMRFATTETLEFILSVVSGTATTLCIILLSPAVLSYIRMFITEQKEYDISDAIYYFTKFKRYTKALRLVISYILRMAVPSLLCFAPVIIFVAIYKLKFHSLMQQDIFTITLCVLVFLSSVCVIMYATRYFLVLHLFCKNESISTSMYFIKSKTIMNNHCGDVMKLIVSFIWWMLLCVFVMPILYVVPYMIQSMCISGKWLLNLKDEQNNELFQQ